MRPSLTICACFLSILALAGCSSSRQTRVSDETARSQSKLRTEEGQELEGYTTMDATYHAFKGRVRLHGPDTLEFFTKQKKSYETEMYPKAYDPKHFLIPRDSVQTVRLVHSDTGKTIFAVLGTTVLVAGVIVAIALATKES